MTAGSVASTAPPTARWPVWAGRGAGASVLAVEASLPHNRRQREGATAMTVKLYAMTCGHLTGKLAYLMEGGEGEVKLPIPAYLIEHPKGRALFDTGMHPACQHDPVA